MMKDILQLAPVIPVIVIDDVAHAVPLAQALVAGGLRVLEVTLRTPVALAAMRAIVDAVPEAVVGAGTVLNADDLYRARDAGAVFGVSPGATPELLRTASTHGWSLLPGVMTPSEAMAAYAAGFDALKLFPAVPAGGIALLKAIAGPMPQLTFCPTGGITAATAPDFLALPNVACVGGSWLTPTDRLAAGDWSAITALAKQATGLGDGKENV